MSKSSPTRFHTLDELCELLGITKAVYYKARRQGAFPEPQRTDSNRPVFDSELVASHQQIVRSRVGANGMPVIFTRRKKASEPVKKTAQNRAKYQDLIAALASLGLEATPEQVEVAMATLPQSGAGLPEAELIRSLFLELRKSK